MAAVFVGWLQCVLDGRSVCWMAAVYVGWLQCVLDNCSVFWTAALYVRYLKCMLCSWVENITISGWCVVQHRVLWDEEFKFNKYLYNFYSSHISLCWTPLLLKYGCSVNIECITLVPIIIIEMIYREMPHIVSNLMAAVISMMANVKHARFDLSKQKNVKIGF